MDAEEQIKKFEELFENQYKEQLMQVVKEGLSYLIVEFQDISQFDIELSEQVLENPEDTIRAAEIAVKQLDITNYEHFRVRIRNLPESQKIRIRDIRSHHLNKLITLNATVRQKSDVRPLVTTARFECPACGNTIPVMQMEQKFKEPSRCGCGRKGKFKLISKELVDVQGADVEESTNELDGGEQPKRMKTFLKQDLVSPLNEKRSNPGTNINLVGILKEVPIQARDGGQLTKYELMIEINYIEPIEEDLYNVEIDEETVEEIKELSKEPKIFQKIVKSFAPGIYGHDKIKEALVLQFVGGVRKVRNDGVKSRGDIHVLLIGDPGAGKSQLLKRSQALAPKARYVSGKGASGAGLTASVVKDEFMGGWSLEAGALVLTNRGICIIDELDKMSHDDRNAMHEALEQQSVSISKANIQATLRSETTVLAAANPKLGRFDPYAMIAEQINLPPSLINRFDLIFPIRDMPSKERDQTLGGFILELHKRQDSEDSEISSDLLRKYIAYARRNCEPVLTQPAIEELLDFYVKIRNSGGADSKGMKSVPISARQLEALVRLAEASAKVRLSKKVLKQDAQKAIELLYSSLSEVGVDPETGNIDIDRISTGVASSERNKIITIREIVNELEEKVGKMIKIDDLVDAAGEKGVSEDKVEEAIEKLKKSGDIFEPKRGFIQKI
mgnify:CR=1 FL=1